MLPGVRGAGTAKPVIARTSAQLAAALRNASVEQVVLDPAGQSVSAPQKTPAALSSAKRGQRALTKRQQACAAGGWRDPPAERGGLAPACAAAAAKRGAALWCAVCKRPLSAFGIPCKSRKGPT